MHFQEADVEIPAALEVDLARAAGLTRKEKQLQLEVCADRFLPCCHLLDV